MSDKLSSISGVLLAYNEESVIRESIASLISVLESCADKIEVIVVGYEGCSDKTNEIVQDLSKKDPRVRLVIQKKTEKGYGRALFLGVKAAKNEWIFQSDADGQYDFKDIKKLVALIEDKVGLVHGYRAKRNDPMERVVFARAYNIVLKALYQMGLRDVDSAFKLFRREAIAGIELESISGFAISELILKIRKKGDYTFRQIPITHLPRTAGEALSEKGIKNPFNLQLPNLDLTLGTFKEVFKHWKELR